MSVLTFSQINCNTISKQCHHSPLIPTLERQQLVWWPPFFSYHCLESEKLIRYSQNQSFLDTSVTLECLYNGQWSHDIKNFNCTHCGKPEDPPNGKFDCQSFFYEEKSSCSLVIFMTFAASVCQVLVERNCFLEATFCQQQVLVPLHT